MEFGENFDNCLDSALHLYIFVYICTYLLVICKYMGYPMATCSNIRTYLIYNSKWSAFSESDVQKIWHYNDSSFDIDFVLYCYISARVCWLLIDKCHADLFFSCD